MYEGADYAHDQVVDEGANAQDVADDSEIPWALLTVGRRVRVDLRDVPFAGKAPWKRAPVDAIVRFVGYTHFATGLSVGVEVCPPGVHTSATVASRFGRTRATDADSASTSIPPADAPAAVARYLAGFPAATNGTVDGFSYFKVAVPGAGAFVRPVRIMPRVAKPSANIIALGVVDSDSDCEGGAVRKGSRVGGGGADGVAVVEGVSGVMLNGAPVVYGTVNQIAKRHSASKTAAAATAAATSGRRGGAATSHPAAPGARRGGAGVRCAHTRNRFPPGAPLPITAIERLKLGEAAPYIDKLHPRILEEIRTRNPLALAQDPNFDVWAGVAELDEEGGIIGGAGGYGGASTALQTRASAAAGGGLSRSVMSERDVVGGRGGGAGADAYSGDLPEEAYEVAAAVSGLSVDVLRGLPREAVTALAGDVGGVTRAPGVVRGGARGASVGRGGDDGVVLHSADGGAGTRAGGVDSLAHSEPYGTRDSQTASSAARQRRVRGGKAMLQMMLPKDASTSVFQRSKERAAAVAAARRQYSGRGFLVQGGGTQVHRVTERVDGGAGAEHAGAYGVEFTGDGHYPAGAHAGGGGADGAAGVRGVSQSAHGGAPRAGGSPPGVRAPHSSPPDAPVATPPGRGGAPFQQQQHSAPAAAQPQGGAETTAGTRGESVDPTAGTVGGTDGAATADPPGPWGPLNRSDAMQLQAKLRDGISLRGLMFKIDGRQFAISVSSVAAALASVLCGGNHTAQLVQPRSTDTKGVEALKDRIASATGGWPSADGSETSCVMTDQELAELFAFYDSDADGALGPQEAYDLMEDAVAAAGAVGEEAAIGEISSTVAAALDLDGDGRVSEADLREFVQRARNAIGV